MNDITGQIVNPKDLSSNHDYQKLIKYYQHAEFIKCKELVDTLENHYPSHPGLLKIKNDLEVKLSLKSMAATKKKEEKRKKQKATLKLSLFAIIGTLIVMVTLFFSYYYLNDHVSAKQLENETAQLTKLHIQADQLLLVGKPRAATEVLERIRLINPSYVNLPDLAERTYDLLLLEVKYQSAQNLAKDNKNNEALAIYQEIEGEMPGMWDVRQQIASIETAIQIASYIEAGNAAYQAEDWGQVISAYEDALALNDKLDEPLMKEQLLQSYMNKIIYLLQNENTSIQDIENAEHYYRKATALISQSQAYASEREILQEVSGNLLVTKFTQIAKASLEDKNQTTTSIANAVSYMRKAAKIMPDNTALQVDLQNAELYQIAFQNFVKMNWEATIPNFNHLLSVDPDFAKGNVSILLYEAYYALGKQYFESSHYEDALKNLKQGEILAWNDSDNQMKLFQIQTLLGNTVGEMDDYKNAVLYYQSALDVIQVIPRLTHSPVIVTKYEEANDLAANENYENAFSVYQEILQDIDLGYSILEIDVNEGTCFALFANEHYSTLEAIFTANNLPKNMINTLDQTLIVPTIE